MSGNLPIPFGDTESGCTKLLRFEQTGHVNSVEPPRIKSTIKSLRWLICFFIKFTFPIARCQFDPTDLKLSFRRRKIDIRKINMIEAIPRSDTVIFHFETYSLRVVDPRCILPRK